MWNIILLLYIGELSRQYPGIGLVVHEVKHQTKWFMKFVIAKNLDALHKVIYL